MRDTDWLLGRQRPLAEKAKNQPHSPKRASWRSTWLVWVVALDCPQEVLVQNVPARNPRPLLQAIALPVHQVLPATADIQKLADLVDGCIGDETAPGQAPQRQETVLTLTGWLDPGDVGSRMHLHVRRQPQTHHIKPSSRSWMVQQTMVPACGTWRGMFPADSQTFCPGKYTGSEVLHQFAWFCAWRGKRRRDARTCFHTLWQRRRLAWTDGTPDTQTGVAGTPVRHAGRCWNQGVMGVLYPG